MSRFELYGRFYIPILSKDQSILDYCYDNGVLYKEIKLYHNSSYPSIWEIRPTKFNTEKSLMFPVIESPLRTKLGKSLYK